VTDSADASVTVIIAAYNCEAFLGRAIASAAEQSLSPAEILIVDDCSTDGTRDVIHAAAAADARVRLIALPQNGGPSAARNAGIEAAQGSWVAPLDADDAFAPDRLARLVPFGVETGADLVADDLAYFDAGANRVTGRGLGSDANLPGIPVTLRAYFAHNLATGTSFDWGLLKPVFRRSTLLRSGIRYKTGLRHGEDFQLVTDLLLQGAVFRLLNEPLYLYTQRYGAVSNRSSGMTRTTIGYGALKDATLDLSRTPAIASDPALVDLLRRRASGLGRLDDAHFFSTATRAMALGAILGRIKRDPSFLPFMSRQVGTALRRRLSRWSTPKDVQ
jgi:succinoglycan biosynthesis protein ExoO